MSEFRVPPASLSRFKGMTETQRKDFILMYKEWKSHPLTKDLMKYVEESLEKEVLENEKKSDFWTRFHFNFSEAMSKGKRLAYRKLLKDI